MNDKYMQEDLNNVVGEIRKQMQRQTEILETLTDQIIELVQLQRKELEDEMTKLRMMTRPGLLNGQQPRRDGDGFPIFDLTGSQPTDAHSPARDLRSSVKRGD